MCYTLQYTNRTENIVKTYPAEDDFQDIDIERTCDWEVPGTYDETGDERFCTFSGEVAARANASYTYWLCPNCRQEHIENS